MFFDSGGVACTFVEDMVKAYPLLRDSFENKCWEITRLQPIEEDILVLAIEDALPIIYKYQEENGNISD